MIPADVGNPVTKLERVKVKNAGCYWDKPIYGTVKFIQDPKSRKIDERLSLYHSNRRKFLIWDI